MGSSGADITLMGILPSVSVDISSAGTIKSAAGQTIMSSQQFISQEPSRSRLIGLCNYNAVLLFSLLISNILLISQDNKFPCSIDVQNVFQ